MLGFLFQKHQKWHMPADGWKAGVWLLQALHPLEKVIGILRISVRFSRLLVETLGNPNMQRTQGQKIA